MHSVVIVLLFCTMICAYRSITRLAPTPILVRGLSQKSLSFDIHSPSPHPTHSIVFLHGILGNKRNWRTFGHEFVKLNPAYQSVAVDNRAHGVSPSLTGPHEVTACANDLINLFNSGSISCVSPPNIICAHSFSGKVALLYIKKCMEQNQALPKHVWILDSLPGAYDQSRDRASRQSVSGIINTVANLPAEFPSKEWVIGELQSKGIQRDIALWLAMNVIPAEEGDMFKFSFDIDTIVELFADYCKVDAWDFLHSYKGTAKLQFIRAGRNDLWTPEVLSRFESLQRQNPNIVLHTMPHVGHWLHSEDLKGTLKIVSDNSR